MEFGPVQVVVVGFTDGEFVGDILPELALLRRRRLICLLDVMFVSKDDDGQLTPITADTAVNWPGLGDVVGELIGFGPYRDRGLSVGPAGGTADGAPGRASLATESWAISDAIPAGMSAAVFLVEHLWAIPLRGAIQRGGGVALEDTWIQPTDLLAAGALTSEAFGLA